MNAILNENLQALANFSQKPLYVVGGAVRDFLSNRQAPTLDLDLSSPMLVEEFLPIAENSGSTQPPFISKRERLNLETSSARTMSTLVSVQINTCADYTPLPKFSLPRTFRSIAVAGILPSTRFITISKPRSSSIR